MPGTPRGGGGGPLCCCPDCGEPGYPVRGGSLYRCENKHNFNKVEAELGKRLKEERERERQREEKKEKGRR
jgi:hypothetical protein